LLHQPKRMREVKVKYLELLLMKMKNTCHIWWQCPSSTDKWGNRIRTIQKVSTMERIFYEKHVSY